MLAMAIISWITALYLVVLFTRGSGSAEHGAVRFVAWLFAVFGITGGLIYDIYGISVAQNSLPGTLTWWLPMLTQGSNIPPGLDRSIITCLSGLVALSSISIIVLISQRAGWITVPDTSRSAAIVSIVVQVVGFIASVLGIISFYLDNLR